jgi:hypothetical protein
MLLGSKTGFLLSLKPKIEKHGLNGLISFNSGQTTINYILIDAS